MNRQGFAVVAEPAAVVRRVEQQRELKGVNKEKEGHGRDLPAPAETGGETLAQKYVQQKDPGQDAETQAGLLRQPVMDISRVDTAGKVKEVMILDYYEIRGKPAAKRRFLKQYRGKGVSDPIRLRKDIDGVTGATITSRSLTDGVRKAVHVHALISSK
ncbi:MAG: FMN-binding protein [Candidatus Omnitrophica bacterium]|nr:FMN-binding protein [Candidatus Omnitrophota bacterium]